MGKQSVGMSWYNQRTKEFADGPPPSEWSFGKKTGGDEQPFLDMLPQTPAAQNLYSVKREQGFSPPEAMRYVLTIVADIHEEAERRLAGKGKQQ